MFDVDEDTDRLDLTDACHWEPMFNQIRHDETFARLIHAAMASFTQGGYPASADIWDDEHAPYRWSNGRYDGDKYAIPVENVEYLQCIGACHQFVDATLYLANKCFPDHTWKPRYGRLHSTVFAEHPYWMNIDLIAPEHVDPMKWSD